MTTYTRLAAVVTAAALTLGLTACGGKADGPQYTEEEQAQIDAANEALDIPADMTVTASPTPPGREAPGGSVEVKEKCDYRATVYMRHPATSGYGSASKEYEGDPNDRRYRPMTMRIDGGEKQGHYLDASHDPAAGAEYTMRFEPEQGGCDIGMWDAPGAEYIFNQRIDGPTTIKIVFPPNDRVWPDEK